MEQKEFVMNHKSWVALSLLGIFSGAQIAEAATTYTPSTSRNGCGGKQLPTSQNKMRNDSRNNLDDQIHGCPSRNGCSNQDLQQGCSAQNRYNDTNNQGNYRQQQSNSANTRQQQNNRYGEADEYYNPSNQQYQQKNKSGSTKQQQLKNDYNYNGCGGQNSCAGH